MRRLAVSNRRHGGLVQVFPVITVPLLPKQGCPETNYDQTRVTDCSAGAALDRESAESAYKIE